MNDQPIETAEQEQRQAQVKQAAFARLEEIMGLSFDRETGQCTTPGEVRMEGELKERWAALVTQIGECRDAQKIEQLQREAGKILREAIQPEAGKTGPSE
jgi:hypothetical protein